MPDEEEKVYTNGKKRPTLTPEARENRCIALAYDLVEQRLLDGSASSQETTHFLKLASSKERLEREKLEKENKLLEAKTKQYEAIVANENLAAQAIEAFKEYSGKTKQDDIEVEESEY